MDYIQLYRIIEESTPMKFDCGLLCQSACCQGDDDQGMLLFPGEKALYAQDMPEGFAVHEVTLPGWGNAHLLTCAGRCPRARRPLSCRIFPLSPHWDGQQFVCRLDSRGVAMCPLCRDVQDALDPAF
ncbi:MAG: hypothetical protein PHO66_01165, partial [Eubacteriales bacterium]|nr:hypothetical protein [Eubacteriales bacterium]